MHYSKIRPAPGCHVSLTEWRALPVSTGPRHTFALGDIHGRYDVMTAALDYINGIPKVSDDSDLVLLGDLNDRGPDSMSCMRLGLNGAGLRAGVSHDIYLPGNHEMLMMGALTDVAVRQLWLENGGKELLCEIGDPNIPTELRARLHAELGDDLTRLIEGPSHHRTGGLLFVHAGLSPNMSIDGCLAQAPSARPYSDHWAWVREPFLLCDEPWTHDDSLVVVHGHTPIASDPGSSGYGQRDKGVPGDWAEIDPGECDAVADRRRINLDTGCGKSSSAVGIAEFNDGQYRLHVVHTD